MTIRGNMTALENLVANWNKMTQPQQKNMIWELLQYQKMLEIQSKKGASFIEVIGVNTMH